LHDAIGLEQRGVPTAAIITAAFVREAEVQRAALGAEGLDTVVITHPLSTLTDAEIQSRADEAVPQVLAILVAV
jgi:uncharacterized membrane protein|tara:strand:- start:512 stop:733 length:222 start_codon:yes stop_codon:yes gene_type:complete